MDTYPFYINLHGGGTMPEAKCECAAPFNNSERKAAKSLGARYADTPSLYFILRMADDRRGRWYHSESQQNSLAHGNCPYYPVGWNF